MGSLWSRKSASLTLVCGKTPLTPEQLTTHDMWISAHPLALLPPTASTLLSTSCRMDAAKASEGPGQAQNHRSTDLPACARSWAGHGLHSAVPLRD